jgi:electron transfer flavoprotein-quinone oxidoreductase
MKEADLAVVGIYMKSFRSYAANQGHERGGGKRMTNKFDVIVVGAGPPVLCCHYGSQSWSESSCDRTWRICRCEKMTGGMLMSQILNEVVPEFWKEAPLQRPVVSQRIMMTSGARSMMVDIGIRSFWNLLLMGFPYAP